LKRWYKWLGLCAVLAVPVLSQEDAFGVHGHIRLTHSADASGAVVWLTRTGGFHDPHIQPVPEHPRLLQKNKTFSPHVLIIPVGSAVEFPNQDPFFHNVFSLFEGKRFDLGLYEAGTTRTVAFDRPGISYIFCNIHPEMSAAIIAVRPPFYYGVSDREGNVIIPSVPPGTYAMQVWHERASPEVLDSLVRRVAISGTSHALGTLVLSEEGSFGRSHLNKYGKEYDTPTPNSPAYGGVKN